MSEKNIIAGIWEPKLGKTVRVTSTYKNKIFALIWVAVGKDGSIYIGKPGKKNLLKMGRSIPYDGSVNIKYDEGTEISDPDAIKKAKISFKASGWVKTNVTENGLRSFKKPLRGITKSEWLCSILFQHPSKFEPLITIRKQDIVLNYPFDNNYPLVCNIGVAPLNYQSPPLIQDANFQVPVILCYKNLQGMSDIEVRLLLYHKTEGAWPPYTYFFWKSQSQKELPDKGVE